MADLQYQPTCVCAEGVTIYKGRHRTLRVTISTDVGDITGSKLWFSVKKEITDEDDDAVIIKKSANNGGSDLQAKIIDGPNRIIEFYIIPTDTATLDHGNYNADAVIEIVSGAKRYQLLENFEFRLRQPVTLAI